MGAKSKRKGKRGEIEVAAFLRDNGFADARRDQQFNGADGSADVLGLVGFHIESKRCEALRLWEAVAQARREAKPGMTPTVWHRSSRRPWIVILDAKDCLDMVKNGR